MKFSLYLLRSFFKSLLLIAVGCVVLFVVIDFVGNIRMWLSRGVADAGPYYLNYLPHILYLTLPIAILIAVVASVGNMSRHLELAAVQASGRSSLRMLIPLLLAGVVFSLGLFVLGELVLPDANFRRLELAQPINNRPKNPRIKERAQFAYISSEKMSWYFDYYSSIKQEAQNVNLLRFRNHQIIERYDAKVMKWTPSSGAKSRDGYWTMTSGFCRHFQKDGSVLVEAFDRLSLREIAQMHPDDLIHSRQTADEMNTQTIRKRIAAQRRSGEETRTLETQLYFKYSGPLVALVTLLIGTALSHRYKRSGGLSTKFGIGLLISFLYYVSLRVGLQMGEAGILSPWLGAWAGSLIFVAVAVVMLMRSFRL
ncbi:MAG TPA: LptF/LptG family permease [Fibrobacteraceae bacterium]|nr:LptF/LptG family permease [Fibrobacteraceae bacterium]